MTLKQIRKSLVRLAILIGSGLHAMPAQAAFTATIKEVGNNVIATGSGTIDVFGLTNTGIIGVAAAIDPSQGVIQVGLTTPVNVESYTGFLISTNAFGIGHLTPADRGSGDTVGMGPGFLVVPQGYSGGPLSGDATFDNETLSSLGATPGTYQWVWPGDSFTLNVEASAAAVPESSSAALLALPFGLIMVLGVLTPAGRKSAFPTPRTAVVRNQAAAA